MVEQLEFMLRLAREGEMDCLAYFYGNGVSRTWGFVNMNDHGQLVASAKLASLAVKEEKAA